MQEELKTYQVTPTTAAYLETLRTLEDFKNNLFKAISLYYGEHCANTIFEENDAHFRAFQDLISKQLTLSIIDGVSTSHGADNVI